MRKGGPTSSRLGVDGTRIAEGRELALRSHRPPCNVRPNQDSTGRGGAQGRAECSGCTCLSWFAMEEIYAKFVSQKISKTRWRPVPPGSLQTADTFAAGSWDNEVPPLLGEKLLLPPFSWNRAAGGPRASSRLLARLAISVPKFPS